MLAGVPAAASSKHCDEASKPGIQQILTGNFQDGLASLRKVVSDCGDSPRARYDLGFGLLANGNLKEAEVEFREALRLNPKFARAHYQLGVTLARRMEATGEETGTYEWDFAISELRTAVELDSKDADARFNLATVLARKKVASEALVEIRECVRLQPLYLGAKALLGAMLYLNAEFEASIPHLRAGVAEQADSITAHDYLGLALMKTGRTQEAVEQFELVTRLDPDYAPVRYSLGMALRKLGRNERAAIELEKFRQLQEREDKRKRKMDFYGETR